MQNHEHPPDAFRISNPRSVTEGDRFFMLGKAMDRQNTPEMLIIQARIVFKEIFLLDESNLMRNILNESREGKSVSRFDEEGMFDMAIH